mgnify:FL=1
MAAWIVLHQIQDKAELRNFDVDGYIFDESISKENHYCFVKIV